MKKKKVLIKMEITNHTEQKRKDMPDARRTCYNTPKIPSVLSFKYVKTEAGFLASCPIEITTGFEVKLQRSNRCLCVGTRPHKILKSLAFISERKSETQILS